MKKVIMLIMAVALIALPTMAQQNQWQSTSTMQTSGSAYTPQVQQVGAASAPVMATTTTETYSPTKGRGNIRKGDFDDSPTDYENQDEGSPIGEPWVLAIFAAAFAAVIAVRRRKKTVE